MMSSTSHTLTARCLCKAHVFTATISSSDLPLSAVACHCTSSRHVTGALYTSAISWPTHPDLSALKRYDYSSRFQLFFCGTCSTPMFRMEDLEAVTVFTGTLENTDVEDGVLLVRFEECIFVGDTLDGGASQWLRRSNADGSVAKVYKEGSKSEEIPEEFIWPQVESTTLNDTVPIRCHCKGVDFLLNKGDYEGKSEQELPWFVDPGTRKPVVGFDACDSCRLSSGVDVFHWTFAELRNISFSSKAPAEFPTSTRELRNLVDSRDPVIGTLVYYASSSDVQRYFCSRCCACVFYAVDDRPNIVDVAVGLLEADGARAERLLHWRLGKVGWASDVKGTWREGLVKCVEQECKKWKEHRESAGVA